MTKRHIEIPEETNDKFLKIAKSYISNNNKKKITKILTLLSKEDKKQKNNDYVCARDLIVAGCVLIGSTMELLDTIKTTQSGHDDLIKLRNLIYNTSANPDIPY